MILRICRESILWGEINFMKTRTSFQQAAANLYRWRRQNCTKLRKRKLLRGAVENVIDALWDKATMQGRNELSFIYAQLLAPLPEYPKTDFEWVAKALSQDETRLAMNFVFVNEHEMIATDGKRLHIAPNKAESGARLLEPGLYDTNCVLVALPQDHNERFFKFFGEDLTYPNVRRIIPRYNEGELKTGFFDPVIRNTRQGKKVTKFGEGWFNPDFLKDVFSRARDSSVKFYHADELSPILILDEERTAVVMPLRVTEADLVEGKST